MDNTIINLVQETAKNTQQINELKKEIAENKKTLQEMFALLQNLKEDLNGDLIPEKVVPCFKSDEFCDEVEKTYGNDIFKEKVTEIYNNKFNSSLKKVFLWLFTAGGIWELIKKYIQ